MEMDLELNYRLFGCIGFRLFVCLFALVRRHSLKDNNREEGNYLETIRSVLAICYFSETELWPQIKQTLMCQIK